MCIRQAQSKKISNFYVSKKPKILVISIFMVDSLTIKVCNIDIFNIIYKGDFYG